MPIDDDLDLEEDLDEELLPSSEVKFKCPTDGVISQDDVIFLCNKCSTADLIHKEGIYICPACLEPGENFECMLCGSKKVEMIER